MKKSGIFSILPAALLLSVWSCDDDPVKDYFRVVDTSPEVIPVITYEYVDLGLSANWATFNVGAESPEEYGNYYAWGEIQPKSRYDWSTYQWCQGTNSSMTKYNDETEFGEIDNLTRLTAADDVACVEWGGSWRMPLLDEAMELVYFCTWTSTTHNGVQGFRVTSKVSGYTDKSIFLPYAGYKFEDELFDEGADVCLWSSDVHTLNYCAWCIDAYHDSEQDYIDGAAVARNCGFSVRPVTTSLTWPVIKGVTLNKEEIELTEGSKSQLLASLTNGFLDYTNVFTVNWSTRDRTVAIVDANGLVTGVGPGTTVITAECRGKTAQSVVKVKPYNPVLEYVDLGLSVKWATCNIGANSPEFTGYYVSWGETDQKEYYHWSSYKWAERIEGYYKFTKYCNHSNSGKDGFTDGLYVLEPGDDYAHVMFGGDWRMPSYDECIELKENCTWIYTQMNGVQGYRITSNVSGYTDRSIFLPVTGWFGGIVFHEDGSLGYWSNTLYPNSSSGAYSLIENGELKAYNRYIGQPVRPVHP